MAVNLEAVDLTKPDPSFKPDPKLRGDAITEVEVEEEEVDIEDEPEAKKEPAKKTPAKKEPVKKEETEELDDEEEPDTEVEDDPEDDDAEDDASSKSTSRAQARIRKVVADKNDALARMKALETENATLRSTQSKEEAKEFDELQTKLETLYEQVEEKRALGEYKDAAKLQRQLDELRGNMSRAETVLLSRQAALAQQEVQVFNSALAQIEAIFPELSSKHKAFDQETLVALDETIKGYEANGDSLPDALRKASRRLLKYDPFARGDAAYLPGNPHTPSKEADPAAKKKPTDIKKNLDASKKQPMDPTDDNSDVATSVDVTKIKPEDWSKLPESIRRKMRGDVR